MRKKALIGICVLVLIWAIPGRAQDTGDAQSGQPPTPNADNSPFNFHIGGGFGVPLGSTASFAGLSGMFQLGAGPNLSKHSSLVGEFMWQGLPANRTVLQQITNILCPPTVNPPQTQNCSSLNASASLDALTANYMYHTNGKRYGFYLIGGGGWYYRHAELHNATLTPGTVCAPVWNWWGYACTNGLVSTNNVLASSAISSGGVNGGVGITINLTESGFKFYMEARYHYSPQGGRISTQTLPVTFGFRW